MPVAMRVGGGIPGPTLETQSAASGAVAVASAGHGVRIDARNRLTTTRHLMTAGTVDVLVWLRTGGAITLDRPRIVPPVRLEMALDDASSVLREDVEAHRVEHEEQLRIACAGHDKSARK